MTVDIHPWNKWYDEEKTILMTTLPAEFTWPEFAEAGDNVWRLMNTVDHSVVHLSDYSNITYRLPPGAFAQLRRIALLLEHRNFEHYVLFGLNSHLLKTMADMFSNIYGQLTFVSTEEEAIAAIRAMRASQA